MKKILFIFLQCTWGLVQTLIGLGFFIALRKRPHRMYRGCIDTQWNHHGGLSLGLFIFTPPDEQQNADLIRVHEYGHAVQSLVLAADVVCGHHFGAVGQSAVFRPQAQDQTSALHRLLCGGMGQPLGRAGHRLQGHLGVSCFHSFWEIPAAHLLS